MEFPHDFPEGMTYHVGTSQWPLDWNYVLPAMADATGAYQPCSGTITFDLEQVPTGSQLASLYLAMAGNDGKSILVTVNGTPVQEVPGAIGSPLPLTADGFCPPYSDTSSIHFSDHGPFGDQRITFPAAALKHGRNALTLTMNTRKMTAFLMVDYLRLELQGYVPPAPPVVEALPGNGQILVQWTPVPGADSYEVLRSTNGGTSTVAAPMVVGPVCGSGRGQAMFVDTAVSNGTSYTYSVVAVNQQGTSAASQSTARVIPATSAPSAAPAAPSRVTVTETGDRHVALRWDAVSGAAQYTIARSTMQPDGLGGFYPISAIRLTTVSGTTYTDHTPSNGRVYTYTVSAENAVGVSTTSAPVQATPRTPAPTTAPTDLTGTWKDFRGGSGIVLSWNAVPGATGYVIYRSDAAAPTFAWPAAFRTALLETTYFDQGNTDKRAKIKGLDTTREYVFQIWAVSTGGVSPPAVVRIPPKATR
jgi:fibronectin type 3 domain-containing protein